jgi:hypothetical protein
LFECANARGGPGQTWTLTKNPNGYATNEATLFVVVLSGASQIGNWSYSNTSDYSGSTIRTTAANSVVVSFWGPADYTGSTSDPDNSYAPPTGWTLGDSAVDALNQNSGADAWITVPSSGSSVNPTWSAANAINNPTSSMWLVEVKP